jgi:TPR repeat protein
LAKGHALTTISSLIFVQSIFWEEPSSATARIPAHMSGEEICSQVAVDACQKRRSSKDCRVALGTDCAEIGLIFLRDKKDGRRFLGRACRLEIAAACYALAELFFKEGDLEKAHILWISACNFKHGKSCFRLMKSDPKRSKAYRRLACAHAYQPACQEVEKRKNPMAATEAPQLRQLCRSASHCFQMGVEREKNRNFQAAIPFFEKACELGGEGACNRSGWLYLRENDDEKAHPLFRKACERKSGKGCNNLAALLEQSQDKHGASTYYKKACELGYAKGCKNSLRFR